MFPGSTLSDHCCRYQHIDAIKLIVVLGELGGQDEYSLVRGSACRMSQPCCYKTALHDTTVFMVETMRPNCRLRHSSRARSPSLWWHGSAERAQSCLKARCSSATPAPAAAAPSSLLRYAQVTSDDAQRSIAHPRLLRLVPGAGCGHHDVVVTSRCPVVMRALSCCAPCGGTAHRALRGLTPNPRAYLLSYY